MKNYKTEIVLNDEQKGRFLRTISAVFEHPEDPDTLAEISCAYISGADNEQGYEVTYNWEGWPDEPGMGTLTEEEVSELIAKEGPHWEEEYSHWIGDKVYVLDTKKIRARNRISKRDDSRHSHRALQLRWLQWTLSQSVE